MAIAAMVALKPSLEQATLVAVQRLAGDQGQVRLRAQLGHYLQLVSGTYRGRESLQRGHQALLLE